MRIRPERLLSETCEAVVGRAFVNIIGLIDPVSGELVKFSGSFSAVTEDRE